MADLNTFTSDVIRSRRIFQVHRIKAARIVEIAIWYFDPEVPLDYVASEPNVTSLAGQVKATYEQIYGINPLILILLEILISAIIKWIIEWWWHHSKEELQFIKMGCVNLQGLINSGYHGWGEDPDPLSVESPEDLMRE